MAIKILKPTRFGDNVTAEHWRIGIFIANSRIQICTVTLDAYVDGKARTDKKDPIDFKEVTIPWSAFKNTKNPNVKDAYEYLATTDDWKDGVEV